MLRYCSLIWSDGFQQGGTNTSGMTLCIFSFPPYAFCLNRLGWLWERFGKELDSDRKYGLGGIGKQNNLGDYLCFSCHMKVTTGLGHFFYPICLIVCSLMGPDEHNGFIQIFDMTLIFIPSCLHFMAARRCCSLWLKLPGSLVSSLLTKVCSSDWIDMRCGASWSFS